MAAFVYTTPPRRERPCGAGCRAASGGATGGKALRQGTAGMGRFLKFLFWVLVLAVLAFIGFALFADLEAPRAPVSLPLDAPAQQ